MKKNASKITKIIDFFLNTGKNRIFYYLKKIRKNLPITEFPSGPNALQQQRKKER